MKRIFFLSLTQQTNGEIGSSRQARHGTVRSNDRTKTSEPANLVATRPPAQAAHITTVFPSAVVAPGSAPRLNSHRQTCRQKTSETKTENACTCVQMYVHTVKYHKITRNERKGTVIFLTSHFPLSWFGVRAKIHIYTCLWLRFEMGYDTGVVFTRKKRFFVRTPHALLSAGDESKIKKRAK